MRFFLAAAFAASMWAAEARAQFEPVRNRREVHATAPFLPIDELFSRGEAPFYPRDFQAFVTVEWNGVDQPQQVMTVTPLVNYDATISVREVTSLITDPVNGCCGNPEWFDAAYGTSRMSGLLSFDATDDTFTVRLAVIEAFGTALEFQYNVHTTIDLPTIWDEPATVNRVRGTRVSPPPERRGQFTAWELNGIQGPWEDTNLILFDGDLVTGVSSSDHFTVTLDRFGWLPVDELIVGAPRRGIQPAMAAAVPEPGGVVLILICVAALSRLRPPAGP